MLSETWNARTINIGNFEKNNIFIFVLKIVSLHRGTFRKLLSIEKL